MTTEAQAGARARIRVGTPVMRQTIKRFLWIIRAAEWWNYKTPLALGMAYALAWREHIPFRALWLPLLLLLGAASSAGVFASVFNDLLDMQEDRAAGKRTGCMTLSRRGKYGALALIECAMLLEAALLARYRCSLICFLTIWALYTFYSLPPIRLKTRGIWGVLCIAVGEHLLASLLAIALVVETTGSALPTAWLAAVSVWSVAIGLRSILWHQLCDYENDRKTQTATFGARYDFALLRRFGEYGVFPIECVSFLVVLVLSHNALVWGLLPAYIALEWVRRRYMALAIIVVAPQENFRFALFEYYQLFFPLALLCSAVPQDTRALGMVALQIVLFPQPVLLCLTHLRYLLRRRR